MADPMETPKPSPEIIFDTGGRWLSQEIYIRFKNIPSTLQIKQSAQSITAEILKVLKPRLERFTLNQLQAPENATKELQTTRIALLICSIYGNLIANAINLKLIEACNNEPQNSQVEALSVTKSDTNQVQENEITITCLPLKDLFSERIFNPKDIITGIKNKIANNQRVRSGRVSFQSPQEFDQVYSLAKGFLVLEKIFQDFLSIINSKLSSASVRRAPSQILQGKVFNIILEAVDHEKLLTQLQSNLDDIDPEEIYKSNFQESLGLYLEFLSELGLASANLEVITKNSLAEILNTLTQVDLSANLDQLFKSLLELDEEDLEGLEAYFQEKIDKLHTRNKIIFESKPDGEQPVLLQIYEIAIFILRERFLNKYESINEYLKKINPENTQFFDNFSDPEVAKKAEKNIGDIYKILKSEFDFLMEQFKIS